LSCWTELVKVFQTLVNLIKTFDARVNLGAALKYGRMFVELFLRLCMPMLDDLFRGHKDCIISLLKTLQLSTRALHHVCGHSKIMKDVSLTNQVPQLKRSLEVFVYRVKAMLTINQCLEAFWLGNLKNRDLKGEEIASQVSHLDMSKDSDKEGAKSSSNEDSMPEDDNSSEDEGSRDVRRLGVVCKRPAKRTRAEIAAAKRQDEEDEGNSDDSNGLQSYSETF